MNALLRLVGGTATLVVLLALRPLVDPQGANAATSSPVNLSPGQVFTDQFTDNRNRWQLVQRAEYDTKIAAGALIATVRSDKWMAASGGSSAFPANVDVQTDVTVKNTSPGTMWGAGIAFRAEERGNDAAYYVYEVQATGRWFFRFHDRDGAWTLISSGDVGFALDPQQPITLKVSSRSNRYALYINGKLMAGVTDSRITASGTPHYISLVATNVEYGLVIAEFRNFQVTALD